MLAVIGFALMIILMFVLIKEKMAPPLAFILLPLIAAVLAGFGLEDVAGFIKTGMNTMRVPQSYSFSRFLISP